MTNIESFRETITNGYTFKGDAITLGGAVYEGQPIENALVKLPLKTLNRHGLIAGATGTGKTKTLQVIAENLSKKGVPVLLMDLKGDLSGIAVSGEVKPFILERLGKIGLDRITYYFSSERSAYARYYFRIWCCIALTYLRPKRYTRGRSRSCIQIL